MKGIIVDYIGTLASIPSDWLLCDGNNSTPNLLGKYLLSVGAGENPGATGGSTTHTHSSPAHNHTQVAHSHSGNTDTGGSISAAESNGSNLSVPDHTHPITTSSTVATNQNTTVTVDAASNDPTYYKVAPIIDSTDYGVKYPISSLILWDKTDLPLGWSLCDGSSGTLDLRNKFLKCVDAAENPGSSGGSATHTHTTTTHTHTQDSHSHSGNTGYDTGGSNSAWTDASVYWRSTHIHAMTIGNATITNQNSSPTMDTINGEPTFKKLLILKNTGVANRPKYAIVKFTGTIANIPLGYVLCDGNNNTPNMLNYFVKGANDSSELENTGGGSAHNHTANSHNHTQDQHSHSITTDNVTASYSRANGDNSKKTVGVHNHTVGTIYATGTNQATTITIDNCSSQANYPPFYKVAYIMQDRDLDVGAYAFMIN